MTKFNDLAKSYYETKNPVYLGKKRTLELELESGGKKPSNDQLTSFLLGQTAYNLFKNLRKKFPRRPIIIKAVGMCQLRPSGCARAFPFQPSKIMDIFNCR